MFNELFKNAKIEESGCHEDINGNTINTAYVHYNNNIYLVRVNETLNKILRVIHINSIFQ